MKNGGKPMPQTNLERTRSEMKKRGIDALIASTPANFFYTAGFQVPIPGMPMIAVVPVDSGTEPTLLLASFNQKFAQHLAPERDIRSYPIWIEIVDAQDIREGRIKKEKKPAQFDPQEIYRRLANILKDKGLQEGTLGIEQESFPPPAYSLLAELTPQARFVDAEPLFWELRSIKTPEEIEILKTAVQITEMGVKAIIAGRMEGATIGELYHRYKMGVMKEISEENALGFEMSRAMISAGDHFVSVRNPGFKIEKGQTIYCDIGLTLNGYVSDIGRTFVVGKPNDLQKKIFGGLEAAYGAALEKLGPGVKMCDVFETAMGAARKAGLDWYTRGHMGHAVGVAPAIEQPPYISPTEKRVFEPNMVICLEAPLYVTGLGGYQIEDEILITKNGYEFLSELPRNLVEL
jgi:Xaa-Pro dipeptidase